MSKARLVITAIELEGRPVAAVIAAYAVSKSWAYELLARYRAEGDAAFQPRSRRPKTSPTAISQATVELIVELRKKLTDAGLDAGPDTIAWHLEHHHQIKISIATVSRGPWPVRGSWNRARRSAPRAPTSGSRQPCPTRPGSPTSPTTA